MKNLQDIEVCVCHMSFTGDSCESYIPGVVCEKDYQPLGLSERTCDLGFTCVYGFCNRTHIGKSVCICDDGASGPFCGEVCCLDCGENGTCGIDQTTGNQTCLCDKQYSGETCGVQSKYIIIAVS